MARGSIYTRQTKSGETRHVIMYRTADGTQVKRTVIGGRRAAERELADAMARVNRGELRSNSNAKFDEYARAWLENHRLHIETGTYDAYERDLRLRLTPCFGELKLRDITPGHIRAYVAELANTGQLSPKSINNSLVCLQQILGQAKDEGIIASNPARGTRKRSLKLAEQHREMDYLRLDEIPRYLAACSPRYRPLATLLIATGMRISEALALTWRDIDWAGNALIVSRSMKGATIGSTKNDNSRRIDLGPNLLQLLRERHAQAHTDLIFPNHQGRHLNRTVVSRDWHHAALRSAGLRNTLRLHDLRHTAAASWLAQGLPMVYLQHRLGHSDISTTIHHYGHLEQSFLSNAAQRAEAGIFTAQQAAHPAN